MKLGRAVWMALAIGVLGCGQMLDNKPCFPSETIEDVPWLSHRDLGWEIDAMASIASAPKTEDAPSETFTRAERDLKTEFYVDAAKGLLAVARGDSHDGRRIRQTAEYHLAITIFRLKYYTEARRLFGIIAAQADHPYRDDAHEWGHRKVCGG